MYRVLPLSFTNHALTGLSIRHARKYIFYHRTARRLNDLFHPSASDLRTFFISAAEFVQFSRSQSILDVDGSDATLTENLQAYSPLTAVLDYHLDDSQLWNDFLVQEDAYQLPFRSNTFTCLASTISALHTSRCLLRNARFSFPNKITVPQRKVPHEKINCYY